MPKGKLIIFSFVFALSEYILLIDIAKVNVLLEAILFQFGFIYAVYFMGFIFLPIFYGLPKSIYFSLIKKEIKIKVVFLYLEGAVIWAIVFFIIHFLITYFIPSLAGRLIDSAGYGWGGILGALYFLFRIIFTKKGKQDLKIDFENYISRYG